LKGSDDFAIIGPFEGALRRAISGEVGATRAYLAGLGTAGSIVVGAAVVFVLASAVVAFRGWPQADGPGPPAQIVLSAPARSDTPVARRLAALTASVVTTTRPRSGPGTTAGVALYPRRSGGLAGAGGSGAGSSSIGEVPTTPPGAPTTINPTQPPATTTPGPTTTAPGTTTTTPAAPTTGGGGAGTVGTVVKTVTGTVGGTVSGTGAQAGTIVKQVTGTVGGPVSGIGSGAGDTISKVTGQVGGVLAGG
jgi:hypothetical protein